MAFKCKIGLHSWDGCKCNNCGKTKETHYELLKIGVECENPCANNFDELLYLFKIGVRFSVLFLFIILFTNTSQLYSQNSLSFSGGITNKWNLLNSKHQLAVLGQEDVISVGGIGYFTTLGIAWSHKKEDNKGGGEKYWSNITIEKFNSQLDNWKRIPIGSVDATIFRFDPWVGDVSGKNPNFVMRISMGAISIFTGNGHLLPHSFCWDPDQNSWELIKQMKIKNSIGWSLFDFEIDYKISPNFLFGLETVFIESDHFKAIFQTYNKEITSPVATTYFFFPLKFRVTVKI